MTKTTEIAVKKFEAAQIDISYCEIESENSHHEYAMNTDKIDWLLANISDNYKRALMGIPGEAALLRKCLEDLEELRRDRDEHLALTLKLIDQRKEKERLLDQLLKDAISTSETAS